jgi:hypothetical protein
MDNVVICISGDELKSPSAPVTTLNNAYVKFYYQPIDREPTADNRVMYIVTKL